MMRRGSAAIVALVLMATVVPASGGHHRKHHRDRQEDCRRDCHNSNSDNDGDGGDRRQYCIMPCNIIVPIPTPGGAEPGPEEQALTLPPSADPRCAPFHCDPKPTALFPPDPKKMTELIQAFASGIGKSAGDLAGAIAAFPPALLL